MWKKGLLCFLFGFTQLSSAREFRKNVWEVTESVWNMGLISECDSGAHAGLVHHFGRDHYFHESYYQNIRSGDIVWVKSGWVREFCEKILPQVSVPIVLVINDGDESFPSDSCRGMDAEALINHDKIIHIFAQNCDYAGPSHKVSHIPIGMDFHTIAHPGGGWGETGSPLKQETDMQQVMQGHLPTSLRKKRAFVDFHHSNSSRGNYNRYLQFGEDRVDIFSRLLLTGLIDYAGWMKRSNLWRTKGQYAFSISPHGNGLDCHRTWEDLVLGCIVIVKTSCLDPLYEGLPVVIVKDWSEVTEENMTTWLSQYGDASTNPSYRERLTNAYWLRKIRAAAEPYRG
jgi:hypothetical protein